MPRPEMTFLVSDQTLGSIEAVLILAIFALVCLALYELFPKWRS